MPQKETQPKNKTRQEASLASFFKIDSQNWPDISPSSPKLKRFQNPYKLLGVVNFNDPVLQRPQTPAVYKRWQIPQSKVKTGKTHEEPNRDNKETTTLQMKIRAQAVELIRKFQLKELELGEVRKFYYQNAEILVDKKPFWAYCKYATRHNLKTMSWSKYARQRVQELFISDLCHLIPPHYYKTTIKTRLKQKYAIFY